MIIFYPSFLWVFINISICVYAHRLMLFSSEKSFFIKALEVQPTCCCTSDVKVSSGNKHTLKLLMSHYVNSDFF